MTHELGSTSCTDKYCCSLIGVIRRNRRDRRSQLSIQIMAEIALRGSEECPSAFAASFGGDCGRDGRDARAYPPLSKSHCRCPRYIFRGVEIRTRPLPPPPRYQLYSHGHPNVRLTVPWGGVAYIRLAENPRTVLPRLRLYLIFSRPSRGSGVPGRLGVESRCGISANLPHRVFLFDHLAQAKGRVSGEEPRCNLSPGPCWKAARQS